jgi:hypothetical protein
MRKTDFSALVGVGGNFSFLYINMSNIAESLQMASVAVNVIGSLGSAFLVAVKISKYYQNRKK